MLFDLANQHARWLSQRQAVLAENVSNAATPGYRARDVMPFQSASMDVLALARTNSNHIGFDQGPSSTAVAVDRRVDPNLSDNTVQVDRELARISEVRSAHALNSAATRLFQRLTIMNLKGG